MKHTIWFAIIIILSGCAAYRCFDTKLRPQFVQISNGRLEYYSFGHGSPIVLISGYATDVSSWNNEFLNALALHHQLIVVNNRNVGGSAIESSNYQSQDLAQDISQLIQHLKLKHPAILGLSMGGMIAQQVAVLHANQISKLILINTAIAGEQSVHPKPEMEKRLLNIPKNKIGLYLVAVNSFFPAGWKLKMAYKLAVDRFQPRNYGQINLSKMVPVQQTLLMAWTKDNITAKKLKNLPMPVLILSGEADQVLPPANSLILAKTIPQVKLVKWKEGGHAMIYQYPKQMANTINQFIN